MVTKKELLEKFQITGCENLSDEVLDKCIELCHWFNKDEEEFLDMWIAFGVAHLDGNLEPTLKGLEELKRTTQRSTNKEPENQNRKYLDVSQTSKWQDDESEMMGILEIYAPEKVSLLTKRPASSDPEDSSSSVGGCKAQAIECEPATLEPVATTTTATQSSQGRAGSKVLMTVGPKVSTWTNANKQKFTVRRAGPHVPSNARYMFELLKTTSEVRTRTCRKIGYLIHSSWHDENKDEITVTWNVRTRQQQKYRTWGRVCFESETKQNNSTAMLEGCRKPPKLNHADSKLWPQVELDVSELRECCLFPGQILAVEGTNLSESLLKVHDVFTGSFIPAAKVPNLTAELKVVVAAGPFTQSNDLNYQPLWEFMTKIVEEEPHILILIGPFLDHTHPHVQDDLLTCSYQEFFNKLITKIKHYIAGKCTQVVLVSSSRDVHHHAVYPTPEYFLPKLIQSPDVHVLPDPCTLDIEGLRLGITSIDCLMHLGREEVTLKPSGTDKLSRWGNYILNQACFYPLYPPAKEVNIDSELWEKYAFLQEKPHMLLLPSDMRYFCKNINECVILNPERLSKRTFAKMNFQPSTDGTWTQNNVSCEIIKM